MTDIPKSPEQWDALSEMIEQFRIELETELPMKLHMFASHGKHSKGGPAGDLGGVEYEQRGPVMEKTGWTGLPFTAPFQRYLGHTENYGYEFIAAASFDKIRDECRSQHPEDHSAGGPTASLCRRLAIAAVELRQPITFTAAQEGLSIAETRRWLTVVLTSAKQWREHKRAMATAHDTEETPISLDERFRRQHDEAREQKVWEVMRRKYPNLPEWEVERERRRADHAKLGCRECNTTAA